MPIRRLKKDFALLILAILSVMTVGAILFSYLEGWSLVDSFYFVTMTATTVGYGDLTPTTPASKVITILFAVSIVPFVLYAFSAVAKFQIDKTYTKIHHLERKQQEQEAEISEHDKELEVVEDIMEDALIK